MFNTIVLPSNYVTDMGTIKLNTTWSLVFIRWYVSYARGVYKVQWEYKGGAVNCCWCVQVGNGKGLERKKTFELGLEGYKTFQKNRGKKKR